MNLATKRAWLAALLGIGLILAVGASSALWNASRAWRDSADKVATEDRVPFASSRLDGTPFAHVEWISTPTVFRDVAVFGGHLFLAGRAGLLEYDAEGELLARYRVGLELPAAPLLRLATGIAPDSGAPGLFVATAGEGLLIFDGRGFRQIRPNDEPYRKLSSVLPLPTGRILLGTQKGGVLVYDGKQITRWHPTVFSKHITALAGDESSLWVGTLDQGVLHWQAGRVQQFGEAEGLPDPQILSLVIAGEKAYAGTPMGVAEFQAGQFSRVLAPGFFAQTLLVREETLAIGTLAEGTVEIPLRVRPIRGPRPQGQPLPSKVQQLLELEGGLFALAEDGLYAVDNRRDAWRPLVQQEDAVLADGNISALEVDTTGRLWVGYFDRGLDIMDPSGTRATHVENEYIFCVNRIVRDSDRGIVAVATANGLVLFDAGGEQRQVLGRPEGLIANHITDVVIRPGGMTLATPAGLTFVDAAGTRSLYAFHGLVNNHAYALASSGDLLLVGTLGGLSVLDGGVIRENHTTANSGLQHNWITAIVPVGTNWFVGTYGAGILRLDSTGQWHEFPEASGSFEINPNAMAVTKSHVYAGTLGRGLYIYDRRSERWTSRVAGLPSANVTAVAIHSGFVYAGTDNGLVRLRERDLSSQ